MTQAVTVRRDGDTFQARLFWLHAARLLDPESPVVRVGFETGPKGFDDIWVEYDPARSALDQYGDPLRREHMQCKWHVTPDSYGYAHLVDPEFINANARSLLQRARAAQLAYAPTGVGVRFKLVTNWRLDRNDPLREMIGNRSGAIRSDSDWESSLYPALRSFLLTAAKDQPRLRLALDAHVTLAFAAGSIINIKSGRHVELEQRSTGRRLWAADDTVSDASWPTLLAESVELCTDQPDLAVAISLTHDVSADVRRYCEATLPHVGRLLILKPSTGSGAQSVACGQHAFELAEATTTSVRAARPATGAGLTHLFVAAPNAFTFFLGQRQPALGSVRLYEFDFDGGRGRAYTPALTLPVTLHNKGSE
jgi:hypothetical protein